MSGSIRVVVVDDHQIVRVGLRQVLQEAVGITVVAEAATAYGALAAVARARPDVAIIDVLVPGGDGPQLVREINSHCPETRCLVFTASTDEEAFFHAVIAGAAGYLLKDADGSRVVEAVRRVAAGEDLVPADVIDELRAREDDVELADALLVELTPQEQRIVKLVVQGCTNREIAAELHLAEKTVRNYVSNVLSKLGMKNRTEVAVHVARLAASARSGGRVPARHDVARARAASMRAHPSAQLSA